MYQASTRREMLWVTTVCMCVWDSSRIQALLFVCVVAPIRIDHVIVFLDVFATMTHLLP